MRNAQRHPQANRYLYLAGDIASVYRFDKIQVQSKCDANREKAASVADTLATRLCATQSERAAERQHDLLFSMSSARPSLDLSRRSVVMLRRGRCEVPEQQTSLSFAFGARRPRILVSLPDIQASLL
jgi:hypothetical protein